MRKKTLKNMERKLFVKKTGRELSKSEEGNTEKRKETLKWGKNHSHLKATVDAVQKKLFFSSLALK